MMLGGLRKTGRFNGAVISEGLSYEHCGSTVLYCAVDRSQNLKNKEMVLEVYREKQRQRERLRDQ